MRQQLLLPLQSPSISAKAPILANHAVTWNHERNGIGRTCASNRPNRTRLTQRFGNVAVRHRLPVRNLTQLLPNLSLERSCSDVEWQIETWFVVIEMTQDLLHWLTQNGVVALDLCVWKLFSQVA